MSLAAIKRRRWRDGTPTERLQKERAPPLCSAAPPLLSTSRKLLQPKQPNSSTGETQQLVGGSSQVNQEIVRNVKLDVQVEQDGNFWAILFSKAFKNLFVGCNF